MDKQVYVGLKAVYGTPMTRGEDNRLRGWVASQTDILSDDGYVLDATNGGV